MRKLSIRSAAISVSVAALCCAVSIATAQSPMYAITSFGVSGISITSSNGGSFALRGSVQQVAQQAMTGGTYIVIGGMASSPPASVFARVYLPYVKH